MKKEDKKSSEGDKFLFYFALALLIVSFAVFFVNISKITKLTGMVLEGTINLTVKNITQINFTTTNINWGSGSVLTGSNATLDTAAGGSNVSNGNWTGVTSGLILENVGNVNVSLQISSGKDAADLLGGTGPIYQFNFTDNEATSCVFNSTTNTSIYRNASTTLRTVCDQLDFRNANDAIRIDVKLVIPLNSKTGPIGDIVTATATGL